MPLDELPLADLAGDQNVEVVVLWPVIRELDKLKTDPQVRDRARKAVARLESLFAAADVAILKTGVKVSIAGAKGLSSALREHDLEAVVGDDLVLAAALAHSSDLTILTDDAGMRLRCRAYGLATLAIPDDYRVQATDPLSVENAKLRRELTNLRNAMPLLTLEFLEGGKHVAVVRAPLDEESLQSAGDFLAPRPLDSTNLPATYNLEREKPTEQEISDYNRRLMEFAPEYDAYVKKRKEFEQFPRVSVPIELVLKNSGSRPATSIEVRLLFPSSLEIFTEDTLPRSPQRPKGPELPGRKRFGFSLDDLARVKENLDLLHGVKVAEPPGPARRVRGDIETCPGDDGTIDVRITLNTLSNFAEAELPKVFARFRTPTSPASFNIQFSLRSHDVPQLIKGHLNVRVVEPD
jgi:rRNA-processing protein FCF1